MLHKVAFANAAAGVTIVLDVTIELVRFAAPSVFPMIFNAQFFGADVASLLPADFSFTRFVFGLIFLTVGAWIVGYLWAAFYNYFAK